MQKIGFGHYDVNSFPKPRKRENEQSAQQPLRPYPAIGFANFLSGDETDLVNSGSPLIKKYESRDVPPTSFLIG